MYEIISLIFLIFQYSITKIKIIKFLNVMSKNQEFILLFNQIFEELN